MSKEDILEMLKISLEMPKATPERETLMTHLIDSAVGAIKKEGISLRNGEYTIEEAQLIMMYAQWLYQKRMGTSDQYEKATFGMNGMPRMLRYSLNQMLLSQKMGGTS